MKVASNGRGPQDITTADIAAAELAAQSHNVLLLADSFQTALQRARRRGEPSREEPRAQSGGRTATRSSSRATEPAGTGPRASDAAEKDEGRTTPGITASDESRSRDVSHSRFSAMSLRQDVARPAETAHAYQMFRLRRASGGASRACIEIEHSRTGTRFLLSRDGDVWLLAVNAGSAPPPAELRSIVATLNEQFAARGLGAIDVIINES
jgi:hypothetical protein